MPRPKLGESESKRLQMVITEDELAAIDDWQFANRVPSRSEAIRRLAAGGLALNKRFIDLKEKILEDIVKVNERNEVLSDFLSQIHSDEDLTRERALQLADLCLTAMSEYEEITWSTLMETSDLLTASVSESYGKARLVDTLVDMLPFRNAFTKAADIVRRALGRGLGGNR